jgi:two-component system response regulator
MESFGRLQPVIIVDDNEDDFEAIARAFKKSGISNPITLYKTGREAVDFLIKAEEGIRPALILLDLNMPGMDGRRVLETLKEDAKLKSIPVIIWTTSSNDRDINACYQMGANAYMQKPVTFEGILEAVKKLKEYWFETVLLPSTGD